MYIYKEKITGSRTKYVQVFVNELSQVEIIKKYF